MPQSDKQDFNPFKELPEEFEEIQAPEELKNKILGSHHMLSLVYNFLELFIGNLLNVFAGVIASIAQSAEATDDTRFSSGFTAGVDVDVEVERPKVKPNNMPTNDEDIPPPNQAVQ